MCWDIYCRFTWEHWLIQNLRKDFQKTSRSQSQNQCQQIQHVELPQHYMKLYAFHLTCCFCLKHNSAKNSKLECYKFSRLLLQCIGIPFISSSHRTCFLWKFPLGDSSKFIKRWSTHDVYVYVLDDYPGKGFVTYMWLLNKTLLDYWVTACGK